MRSEAEIRDLLQGILADDRAPTYIGGERTAATVVVNAGLALQQVAMAAAFRALQWALGDIAELTAVLQPDADKNQIR